MESIEARLDALEFLVTRLLATMIQSSPELDRAIKELTDSIDELSDDLSSMHGMEKTPGQTFDGKGLAHALRRLVTDAVEKDAYSLDDEGFGRLVRRNRSKVSSPDR